MKSHTYILRHCHQNTNYRYLSGHVFCTCICLVHTVSSIVSRALFKRVLLYCTVFAEHILALLLLPFLSSIASNALRHIFSHKQHNCRIASIRLEYCSVEYQNSPSTTDFAQRNSCDTDSTRLDSTQHKHNSNFSNFAFALISTSYLLTMYCSQTCRSFPFLYSAEVLLLLHSMHIHSSQSN